MASGLPGVQASLELGSGEFRWPQGRCGLQLRGPKRQCKRQPYPQQWTLPLQKRDGGLCNVMQSSPTLREMRGGGLSVDRC